MKTIDLFISPINFLFIILGWLHAILAYLLQNTSISIMEFFVGLIIGMLTYWVVSVFINALLARRFDE